MLFYKISANRIYTIYMQCAFQMPTGAKHFMFRSGADTSSMFLKFSKGVFPSGQSKPQLLMEQNRQLGVAASPLVSSIWGRKSSAWPNILPLPSVLCQLKKKKKQNTSYYTTQKWHSSVGTQLLSTFSTSTLIQPIPILCFPTCPAWCSLKG